MTWAPVITSQGPSSVFIMTAEMNMKNMYKYVFKTVFMNKTKYFKTSTDVPTCESVMEERRN